MSNKSVKIITSPFAPPVANKFECLGLNCNALIAPECLVILEMTASLLVICQPIHHGQGVLSTDEPRTVDQLVRIP